MTERSLTPAEQTLLASLEKVASTEKLTPEIQEEFYSALDQAVEEKRRIEASIASAAKTANRIFNA
jgi:hypothetical protein